MSRVGAESDELRQEIQTSLAAAHGHPSSLRIQLRKARANFANWVPRLMKLAGENHDEVGQTAGELLLRLVSTAEDLDQLLEIYRSLPRQTSALAEVAMLVTERLLQSLPEIERLQGPDAAMLWNNLAVRCREADRPERALQLAEQALRVATSFQDARPEAQRVQVMCLLTAAKERAEHGQKEAAALAAQEACRRAATLARSGAAEDKLLEARALTLQANRLAEVGRVEEAIASAQTAKAALGRVPEKGGSRYDLAIAELALANLFNNLGRFAQALPAAHKADRIFRSLVGVDPDQYLEYGNAAANTLAIALSRTGKQEAAHGVLERTVNRMKVLAARQPKRFARDFAAQLINLSDARGEVGCYDQALSLGREALRHARLLERRLGQRDWHLEVVAGNSLFNLLYRLGRFCEAARLARRMVACACQIPDSHPEAAVERARTLRNLAEAQRMVTRAKASDRPAVIARQAVEIVQQAPRRSSGAVMLLEAHCRATLAGCLEYAGKLAEAVIEEERSLRLRRDLQKRSQVVYRAEVASSLYRLSRLQLKLRHVEEARQNAQEAVTHYEAVLPSSPAWTVGFLAASLGVLAQAILAGGQVTDAVRTFERGIELLRPRYAASPEVWMGHLLPLCSEYVEACASAGVPFRTELVEDVIARAKADAGLP